MTSKLGCDYIDEVTSSQEGLKVPSFVNVIACKHEFLAFHCRPLLNGEMRLEA